MATTIVTKNGSGAPTASDLVAGELAVDLTNKRLYTEDSGGTVLELGTNPASNVTFGDNTKAIFGAGSDLQIYHNGSHSIISDTGTGNLKLGGTGLELMNGALSEYYFAAIENAGVYLYYDNAAKLTTTATGIDVTGTVTADGITNNGDVVFSKSTTGVPIIKMSGFATANNPYGIINFYNEDGSQQGPNNAVQIKALAKNVDGSGGELAFYTSTGTGSEGADAVERMRIDASGNLLVGDTSTVPFDGTSGVLIGGARTSLAFATTGHTHKMLYSVNSGTAGLHFYDSTNNRTDMIWDNSGNFLVGTTDTSLYNNTSGGGAAFMVVGDGIRLDLARDGDVATFNRMSGTGTLVEMRQGGLTVGTISVTASATAYNTSSDQRLKENIVDAPSASDDIDAIQVRSFDWKVDGSHQKYGMVAQELQTVAPEAVSAPEDPEEMMGVDYSKLVPMMLKEIQSLRARVAQLES